MPAHAIDTDLVGGQQQHNLRPTLAKHTQGNSAAAV